MTELEKAVQEATEDALGLIKKSQMALPMGTTNLTKPEIIRNRKDGIFTKPEARQMFNEAHHSAYTRTNASGTVSHIQAKGAQKVFAQSDKKTGKITFHDWDTAKEIPNYEGEYTIYHNGTGSQMHTWIDRYGERNHSTMTKEQYNSKYGEDFGREHDTKKQQLLDGVHKVGNDLLNNPKMAEHHAEINTMIGDLKKYPETKHAALVASRMKEMAEAVMKPQKTEAH